MRDLLFAIIYLDDIIIYSKTIEDHLKQVFNKLWNAKMSMKLSKCHFFAKGIQYLGNILSGTGIKPAIKTEAITVMQPPRSAKQV